MLLVCLTCQYYGASGAAQSLLSWKASHASIMERLGALKASEAGKPHMPAFWGAQERPKPPKLVGLTCQSFEAPECAQSLQSRYASHASILL